MQIVLERGKLSPRVLKLFRETGSEQLQKRVQVSGSRCWCWWCM